MEAQTPQSQPEKNDYEATDDSKSLKTDVLILRQEAGKQVWGVTRVLEAMLFYLKFLALCTVAEINMNNYI